MPTIAHYLAQQPVFNPAGLLPFYLGSNQLGWVEPEIASILCSQTQDWKINQQTLYLDSPQPAQAMYQAAKILQQQGLIQGWRNEQYGVYAPNSNSAADFTQPLLALERAAFRRFGLLSRAVHINGYYPDGSLCIARRAKTKSIDPDRLDNMAAGGIPLGEDPRDCAIRELFEEAGFKSQFSNTLVLQETILMQRNEIDGTHRELLYCFDLALPADFIPHNQDGEVGAFYRMSPAQAINDLSQMTWDAGVVTARFLQRQQFQCL